MGICGGKVLLAQEEEEEMSKNIHIGDNAWMNDTIDANKMMEMVLVNWNMAGVNANAYVIFFLCLCSSHSSRRRADIRLIFATRKRSIHTSIR